MSSIYKFSSIPVVLFLWFIFLACPTTAAALQSRDVSAAILSNLELFSQYCSATSCNSNDNSAPGTLIKCPGGSCPRVEAAGATVLANFLNQGVTLFSGFLAVDPIDKRIILAFRGAEGTGFLTLLGSYLTPCPDVCTNCQCHAGFYNSWLETRAVVAPLLATYLPQYPNHTVVITGYSLGATQAAFAVAELRKNGTSATLYNYGQPRIGDLNLVTYITNQGNNYRVTHTNDVIPRIIATSAGFRHISPEYWISHDVNSQFTVGTDQIDVLDGYNNLNGNGGTGGLGALAHVQYFQSNIGGCSSLLG